LTLLGKTKAARFGSEGFRLVSPWRRIFESFSERFLKRFHQRASGIFPDAEFDTRTCHRAKPMQVNFRSFNRDASSILHPRAGLSRRYTPVSHCLAKLHRKVLQGFKKTIIQLKVISNPRRPEGRRGFVISSGVKSFQMRDAGEERNEPY
jgi:hypothetical protein